MEAIAKRVLPLPVGSIRARFSRLSMNSTTKIRVPYCIVKMDSWFDCNVGTTPVWRAIRSRRRIGKKWGNVNASLAAGPIVLHPLKVLKRLTLGKRK
jgi:hypothetical protein